MDFKKLISDLTVAGFKQAKIAQDVGCSQANVSDISVGKVRQPNYALGVRLIALHKKHMRKPSRAKKEVKAV